MGVDDGESVSVGKDVAVTVSAKGVDVAEFTGTRVRVSVAVGALVAGSVRIAVAVAIIGLLVAVTDGSVADAQPERMPANRKTAKKIWQAVNFFIFFFLPHLLPA